MFGEKKVGKLFLQELSSIWPVFNYALNFSLKLDDLLPLDRNIEPRHIEFAIKEYLGFLYDTVSTKLGSMSTVGHYGSLEAFRAAGIDRDNLTCGDVYAYFQYCLLKKLPTDELKEKWNLVFYSMIFEAHPVARRFLK